MTTEPTIEMMNATIAIFMGYEQYQDRSGTWFKKEGLIMCMHHRLDDLCYHKSWDALMEAWKKAGEMLFDIRGDLNDDKYLEAHKITKLFMDACQKVQIENAHNSVYDAIQFLTWFNQQKQNDEQ